jgi:polynucleotide 5'-kinase involved in rRNA processing
LEANRAVLEIAKDEDAWIDELAISHLLQSWRFPTMRHRQEEIKEAYQRTFQWIFQITYNERRPWSSFTDWLSQDSRVYWVNGKAGSGKSTLMRYIFDNPDTRHHLEYWSKDALIVSLQTSQWQILLPNGLNKFDHALIDMSRKHL